MRIRFAKSSDAKALARIHQECGKKQPDSFMHQLGLSFLTTYYEISIEEKHSVILVSEREDGVIVGFHSGTMYAEEHYAALKKNKLKLGLSCIPLLFTYPFLIPGIYKRYKASQSTKDELIIKAGPRGEYWAWLSGHPPEESIRLHRIWHEVMHSLGVEYVYSEINLTHKRIYNAVSFLGAELVREIVTINGTRRAIVRYNLRSLVVKHRSIEGF